MTSSSVERQLVKRGVDREPWIWQRVFCLQIMHVELRILVLADAVTEIQSYEMSLNGLFMRLLLLGVVAAYNYF